MPEFSDIENLFVVAPTITIVIICMSIGWWARNRSAQTHIDDLNKFIEFLKERDK